MAASNLHPHATPLPDEGLQCLSSVALDARLEEEISRAERHGTQLSCLLIVIENLDGLAREHGEELREQALAYAAHALRHELRRFDRVGRPSDRELVIVLPGADGPRGEMVARRVLDRLRAIKVEAGGARRALQVSVGLAAWSEGTDAAEVLRRARSAARRGNGEDRPGQPGQGQQPGASAQQHTAGETAGAEPARPPLGPPARS